MSEKVKFLFDECIGKPALARIAGCIVFARKANVELKHLLEFAPPGTLDEEWVPIMAPEGWIVITGDRGKKGSRGGKLPIVCQAAKVIHELLSSAVNNSPTLDKIAAIVTVWDELLETANAPPGTQFRIQKTKTRFKRVRVEA